MKAKKGYEKRIKLIKKYGSGKYAQGPSPEEIKEAYEYLDSCMNCGKEFTFWDRITFNVIHSMFGNSHRRDCEKEKKKND